MLPVVGKVPLQPPEAVQLLALVALHCSVADVPMSTLLALAFKDTNGGVTTAGVAGLLGVCGDVAFELAPHAASALRAANPSIDFNANANLVRWLRRIELITRLPRFTATTFPRSLIPFIRNL